MFIFRSNYGSSRAPNPKRCAASVSGMGGFHISQCSRKPAVQREVEGKTYGFCKQHDPIAVKAKQTARNEKWNREARECQARWNRQEQNQKALAACKVTLQKIAAGHNDPRTLAVETLALFPKETTE